METLIILLLMWHIVICIVYIILSSKKRIAKAVLPIVIFIPYIGFIALGIIYLISKANKKVSEYERDEVFLETNKMSHVSQIDQDKEKNIVPVEEALILNNHNVQRQMVMEIAKRDPREYLTQLKQALLSTDTETAHYAASSILELKREYDKAVINAKNIYERNKESRIARNTYIRALDNILIANLNLDTINKSYNKIIVDLLIDDIEKSEKPLEDSFEKLIEYLITLGEFDKAQSWMKKYHTIYSRSDKMLRIQLDVAYKTKNDAMFEKTIAEIRDAEFTVTQKTMDMLKFWEKEQLYEKKLTP